MRGGAGSHRAAMLSFSENSTVDERLKALMDYTKFHIGLYTTLCTLLIAIIGIEGLKSYAQSMLPFLFGTLFFFVIAGAFGGIIGSNLPYYTTWGAFSTARLGPWFWPRRWRMPALWVASAEHTAFWLGILVALGGVVRAAYFSTAATPQICGI